MCLVLGFVYRHVMSLGLTFPAKLFIQVRAVKKGDSLQSMPLGQELDR